jgi:hypothetical protein
MSIRHNYSGWARRWISIASVAWIVLLLVSVIAIRARATPQDKPMERTDEKKVTAAGGTMKSMDHTVVGTVREFDAGKKVKVLVGKKTRSFMLDSKSVKTTVDPSVAVGSKVKVVESKDANGIRTLTVNPES